MTLKGERVSPVRSMFQVEGQASEKALRVKLTYCASGTTKWLMWLEKRKIQYSAYTQLCLGVLLERRAENVTKDQRKSEVKKVLPCTFLDTENHMPPWP